MKNTPSSRLNSDVCRLVGALCALALFAGCSTIGPPPATPTPPASSSPSTPSTSNAAPVAPTPAPSPVTQRLRDEAARLWPLASSEFGRRFLAATAALPAEAPRDVWIDPATREYFSSASPAGMDDARRAKLTKVVLDEERYYFTKYGSSLAYLRALDLAAVHFNGQSPTRVMDFGYGSIAHLRLLASLGIDAVGVDPDSYLRALYAAPSDQGVFSKGRVSLVHARWPTDPVAKTAVAAGGAYDLIVSKNTLKRGYIKPERPANKRQLIDLGVSDTVFLAAVRDALKPGGLLVIYNLSPKPTPPDKEFQPWSDGRSPYSVAQYQQAGFEVLVYDVDDSVFAREMGRALGWDKNAAGEPVNDLDTNLFGQVTVVRRLG